MPGEQEIQGHTDRVQVLPWRRYFAAKGFGRDVTGCARQRPGQVLRETGAVGEAEIQQAQFTVVPQQQVFRFDIAMQNLPSMQQADRSQQAFGDVLPLGQRQRPVLLMPVRQGSARIFAHHVVQMLTLTGGMYFRKMPAGHAFEKPLFRQQRLPGLVIVVQAPRQGFQQPGLLLTVANAIKQRLLALCDDSFDLPALERLTWFQGWRQWPLL
ncbi:hypothetical protein D3C84_726370 [compost metagenome]